MPARDQGKLPVPQAAHDAVRTASPAREAAICRTRIVTKPRAGIRETGRAR